MPKTRSGNRSTPTTGGAKRGGGGGNNDGPIKKRPRVIPRDDQLNDLVRDYTDLLSDWRKYKRDLVRLYHQSVILRDRMVCPNCKGEAEISDEVVANKDGTGNWENTHQLDAEGLCYSCDFQSYNQFFRKRKIEIDGADQADSSGSELEDGEILGGDEDE